MSERRSGRRELLREYILACVRDNVFSFSDLASPDVVEKLVGAVSSDLRAVVGDMLRAGASNGLRALGGLFDSLSRRAVKKG